MASYTVPYDVTEGLVAIHRAVVPPDIGNPQRADGAPEIYAMAEQMAIAENVSRNWQRMARVSYADRAYLDVQAGGVGLHRQSTPGPGSTTPGATIPAVGTSATLDLSDPAHGDTFHDALEALAVGTVGNTYTYTIAADASGGGHSLDESGAPGFVFHFTGSTTTIGDMEASIAASANLRVKTPDPNPGTTIPADAVFSGLPFSGGVTLTPATTGPDIYVPGPLVPEGDPSLRTRIQSPPEAVTPDLIVEALQDIVDLYGGGRVYLVELPRDGFRYGRKQAWRRGWRWGSSERGTVIALIPMAAAGALGPCTDALRVKVTAGKGYLVQLYT